MDPDEHDALLRTLAGIATHQKTLHAELRERNRQQVAISAPMEATLARMDTTLTRMKTILARRLPPGEHGREA